jgi:glucokinase
MRRRPGRVEASRVALAFDIGGTSIRGGFVRSDGRLLAIRRASTPPTALPRDTLEVMLTMARDLLQITPSDAQLTGTGISIAAFVTQTGRVTATAHLAPSWVDTDLDALLTELPAPHAFGLDSPTAALGEAYFGAGKGARDLVYVTVSTGIGAAVVIDGRHWGGGSGWAGGIGHTIIDEKSDRICAGCRNRGCLETFAARQGIETTAAELMLEHPFGKLAQLTGNDPANVSARLVAEAAAAGDPGAVEALARAGHALGLGLTNLVDVLGPTMVIVGGGIALSGDPFLEPARAVVRSRAFPPILRQVPIVQARLGDLSGLYGAAAMVLYDAHVATPIETPP